MDEENMVKIAEFFLKKKHTIQRYTFANANGNRCIVFRKRLVFICVQTLGKYSLDTNSGLLVSPL